MIRFLVVFFFILTSSSFAEIKKINIIGNSRVNSNTIDLLVDKKTNCWNWNASVRDGYGRFKADKKILKVLRI